MSTAGGVQKHKYQLNVLVKEVCAGCRWCNFPYKAKSTIRDEKGSFPLVTYRNEDDVWEMIKKLYNEASKLSNDMSDDPIVDVLYQLPYFCCPNVILDQEIQDDISMYVYCEDTKTQPFPGTYGDVPAKWLHIHFFLKNAISARQAEYRKKYERKLKQKSKRMQ